ncbi:hypothetical protein BGZ47_010568, partial [Haplosporangium gracile]
MKFSSQLCQLALCGLLWRVSTGAPPTMAYFSAYVTVDESTLYMQGGSSDSTTDITYNQFYSLDLTQSWDTSNPPWSEIPTVGPIPPELKTWAAADPTTDRVYIPEGANKGMLVFEPASRTSTVLAMPPSDKNDTNSTGIVPPPLVGSCMVSAHNGAKMVLFGGMNAAAEEYSGTLYILDVPTMTWSQGSSSLPRLGMVCSVSGDYFIVWGGLSIAIDGHLSPISEIPIVYNIKSGQWTTQFVDKKTSNDNNKKHTTIIGCAVGAGAVAMLIVIAIIVRWRRHRQQKKKETQESPSPQVRPGEEIEK